MFSSLFPNPNRPSEIMDEKKAERVIDVFLNYRRPEVVIGLLIGWCVFLGMIASVIVTVDYARSIF